MDENDPIRKHQDRLQQSIDKTERLRPILRSCQDAIARCGDGCHYSVTVGAYNAIDPSVEIVACCSRLDELVPLFRELAKEGLKTDKRNTHKDVNVLDVLPMREYNLGPLCKVIAIIAPKDGEEGRSCRMEKVGTKEVPIYKMVCDGEEVPAP